MKFKQQESKNTDSNYYSLFKFEGLEPSFGLTLANALNRTLQNDIFGVVITSFSFQSKQKLILENLFREDILELIFNLQNVVLKSDYIIKTRFNLPCSENKIYTANDILIDENIRVINSKQYLFTKDNDIDLNLILNIETGKGLKTSLQNEINSFIPLDVKFSPVTKTSFKVKLEPYEGNSLKETLFFEVWTNKSLTPKRCILEAIKILSKRLVQFLV